ncbi:MAG: helix-turn-helix domain-containing protein [Deltaproteobacteria bacterium]|nr:helix-turn-helix domain-containing protein [Deltaproteobacteria bacterium]
MADDIILCERDAARILGLSPRALQAWRCQGRGPQFIRVSSRCVRYRREDLDSFLAARVVSSTSQPTLADLVDGGLR